MFQRQPKTFGEKQRELRIFSDTLRSEVLRAAKEVGALGRVGIEIVADVGGDPKVAGVYYNRLIQVAACWHSWTKPYKATWHELICWAREELFTPLERAALARLRATTTS